MKRGEVWLVAGGVYASKPRAAVVIQDDRYDATDSVTVCPLTSTALPAPLLRMPVVADAVNGLDVDSEIMIDKPTTVRRSNVVRKVGNLTSAQLLETERLLMAFLGLAD